MQVMGAFSGLITVFILIAVFLAFLMPFFVLRIRNELISMNKKLSRLIELLSAQENVSGRVVSNIETAKECPHCNARNRQEDRMCLGCGKAI